MEGVTISSKEIQDAFEAVSMAEEALKKLTLANRTVPAGEKRLLKVTADRFMFSVGRIRTERQPRVGSVTKP